ncbi:MAG: hypothetical protein CMJ36_02990 [Phycisphaerae bacterium]|nr:hypothetical protein [Phycisphaerae bacterium]
MIKRPILNILLGCSIVFNVFFIFGAMQWRSLDRKPIGHAGMVKRVVDAMNLDDDQRIAFESMHEDFEAETAVISEQISELESSIANLLASDDPDLQQVDVLIEQKTLLRNERRRAGSERFEAFLAMLTPEQRHELGRRMEQRQRHAGSDQGRLDRLLKRFDENGNGTLEPDEQKQADAFLEQRRNERQRPVDATLFSRFDLDEDGLLSPDEADELGAYLQSDRPRRGGPARGPHGPRGPRGPRQPGDQGADPTNSP